MEGKGEKHGDSKVRKMTNENTLISTTNANCDQANCKKRESWHTNGEANGDNDNSNASGENDSTATPKEHEPLQQKNNVTKEVSMGTIN